MEYCFHIWNKMACSGISLALQHILHGKTPVIVCIGSDLTIGDCVGPVCGSLLTQIKRTPFFIYGTLQNTITAKEIGYMHEFLRETHPDQPIIAVDAAVGDAGDIGLIKVTDGGLFPGLGANKKLQRIGDVGILGIVAERSLFNYSLLNLTRLKLVWELADRISKGITRYAQDVFDLPSGAQKYSA